MEVTQILQAIASLIFVVALIGLSATLYRKYLLDKNLLRGAPRRLKVEENLYIDARRKLVLVRKDNEEILLLLGNNTETVISTNLLDSSAVEALEEARKPARQKKSKH